MAFGVKAPEADEMQGGPSNKLTEPGKYHVVITGVKEGVSSNGKPIDGFTVDCDVLAGSTPGQEGKNLNLTFFAAKPTDTEDQQRNTERVNTNFALATGQCTPEQLGTEFEFDPSATEGQHMVVHMERKQKNDGNGNWIDDGKFLRIAYGEVLHIDDPDAKEVPKHVGSLKFIDAKYRHDAAWFAWKKKKTPGSKVAEKKPAVAAQDF